MELRQLEYFVAVADTGGFGRAARSLRIVQAAVSQQIQRLERRLGTRLFDRDRRVVRLTAAGERLLPEARAVLAAAERMRRVADGLATGAEGQLRLGTSRAADTQVLRLLEQLAVRQPRLRVRRVPVSHNERLAAVVDGELDAAVVRALDEHPELELTPLWTRPAVAALPTAHPVTELPHPSLADLAALPLRLAPRHHNPAFCDLVVAGCRTAAATPPPGPPFDGFQATLHAIAAEAPSWTVFYPLAEPPAIPGVTYRDLPELPVTTALATRPGPAGPALRHLLAAARAL